MHRALAKAAGIRRAFGTSSAQLVNPYPYRLVRGEPAADGPTAGLASLRFAAGGGGDPSSVVGWLRGGGQAAPSDGAALRPAQFVENGRFWARVERVLARHAHEDPELQAQAAFQKSGWLNIADGRNPPALGRTGEPEDIVGCVLVEDKAIRRGSFQPNPAHRPVTSHGLFQLPQFLHARLVDDLAA
ncbi:hypothetical protein GGI04_003580 [Coemansia thaxteri]|uniref:Uncharacterized protein n=1 Tax=Coemansia thaxteri TaxID=2663907 RepID=A0A9W8EJE4_9FUNG|nr:hypothetical protein GGI04_003580 [Coemansia thaxteri]KAJ2003198.1 hypothetical protein H4R26_003197 [Coemansia thaxteri]KAJ2467238.1 hypothetical protein GGI02_004101 [Coemansia sp. RSA 2322]